MEKVLDLHGVNEIPYGYLGGGNIILFNNNSRIEMENDTSEVIEFRPPSNYYIEDGEPWGPTEPIWTFRDTFYAPKQSGVFRLPNGNTFVTVSSDGYMFEVTYDKEIVWEHYGSSNTFRAQKYGMDYLILSGDVSGDGVINIIDVVLTVNNILNDLYIIESDINEDGILNVFDLVIMINWIMNGMECTDESPDDNDGDGINDICDDDDDNDGCLDNNDDHPLHWSDDYDGDGLSDDCDCDDDNDGCMECQDPEGICP